LRRLYVYYRVAAADLDAAVAAAQALHAALHAERPTLRCEVLRRPGADATGLVTLMEVYAAAIEVDDRLAAQIEARAAAALKAFVVGDRHTEIFEPAG
jgi:quinol monooxygenase YgiN